MHFILKGKDLHLGEKILFLKSLTALKRMARINPSELFPMNNPWMYI